jgi:hypothetical protein
LKKRGRGKRVKRGKGRRVKRGRGKRVKKICPVLKYVYQFLEYSLLRIVQNQDGTNKIHSFS